MKLRNSFQAHISVVLALLLLVVIASVYLAVKAATITAASDQSEEQLKTGTRVIESFFELRGRRIQYGLNWLTNDSDFRAATMDGSPQKFCMHCKSSSQIFGAVSSSCSTCKAKLLQAR